MTSLFKDHNEIWNHTKTELISIIEEKIGKTYKNSFDSIFNENKEEFLELTKLSVYKKIKEIKPNTDDIKYWEDRIEIMNRLFNDDSSNIDFNMNTINSFCYFFDINNNIFKDSYFLENVYNSIQLLKKQTKNLNIIFYLTLSLINENIFKNINKERGIFSLLKKNAKENIMNIIEELTNLSKIKKFNKKNDFLKNIENFNQVIQMTIPNEIKKLIDDYFDQLLFLNSNENIIILLGCIVIDISPGLFWSDLDVIRSFIPKPEKESYIQDLLEISKKLDIEANEPIIEKKNNLFKKYDWNSNANKKTNKVNLFKDDSFPSLNSSTSEVNKNYLEKTDSIIRTDEKKKETLFIDDEEQKLKKQLRKSGTLFIDE